MLTSPRCVERTGAAEATAGDVDAGAGREFARSASGLEATAVVDTWESAVNSLTSDLTGEATGSRSPVSICD